MAHGLSSMPPRELPLAIAIRGRTHTRHLLSLGFTAVAAARVCCGSHRGVAPGGGRLAH